MPPPPPRPYRSRSTADWYAERPPRGPPRPPCEPPGRRPPPPRAPRRCSAMRYSGISGSSKSSSSSLSGARFAVLGAAVVPSCESQTEPNGVVRGPRGATGSSSTSSASSSRSRAGPDGWPCGEAGRSVFTGARTSRRVRGHALVRVHRDGGGGGRPRPRAARCPRRRLAERFDRSPTSRRSVRRPVLPGRPA